MAQIHIQRKRRRPWPWIFGLLAALLLAWLLFRALEGPKDPGEVEPIDTGQTSYAPTPIAPDLLYPQKCSNTANLQKVI